MATEKTIIYQFRTKIPFAVWQHIQEGTEVYNKILRGINKANGWNGWTTLDPEVEEPDPPKECRDAQRNFRGTFTHQMNVTIWSDGTHTLELV
jgi:hypothetical protein